MQRKSKGGRYSGGARFHRSFTTHPTIRRGVSLRPRSLTPSHRSRDPARRLDYLIRIAHALHTSSTRHLHLQYNPTPPSHHARFGSRNSEFGVCLQHIGITKATRHRYNERHTLLKVFTSKARTYTGRRNPRRTSCLPCDVVLLPCTAC